MISDLRLFRLRHPAVIFLMTLITVVAFSGNTCQAGEIIHKTLAVGEKAPMFKSFTIEGQPFDLEQQLSEKGIVLFFWSFFCSPCREEMPLIQQFYQEMNDKPVEIAGVNLDETALHNPIKNYIKSSGFTYPIVVNKYENEDAKLDKLYLVTGTPVIYMIGQDGTISFAHVGRLELEDFKKAVRENLLTPGM